MDIEYHSRLVPEFLASPDRGRHWRLVAPFEFSVDGLHFIIPVDFRTDFASVPRFLWPVISPYDLGVGPIPHDFGYFTGHANKAYWDLVFLACMEKDRVANWRRQPAYRAVSWFGGAVWDGYRRTNQMNVLFETASAAGAKGLPRLEIANWGIRHHAPSTEPVATLDRLQARWLGETTVRTGL